MSHIAQVSLRVTDLDSLRKACDHFGYEFREGQTTYTWYGTHEGVADGEEGGKCVHAIRAKDFSDKAQDYEVGIIKNSDGSYSLVYDGFDWGGEGNPLGGGKLEAAFGKDLARLKAEYGAIVAAKDMASRLTGYGYYIETTREANGYPKVRAYKP